MLSEGVTTHQPATFDFEPVEFSTDLVPAKPLGLVSESRGQWNESQRGRMEVLTWIEPDARSIELQVRGGLIAHYRDRGNVVFELFADKEATLQPVAEDRSVPPDGEIRAIRLTSPYSGLHRLQWNDGNDRTEVRLPEGLPWTIRSTIDAPMRLSGRWTLYFYVPVGKSSVGGYASETTGQIVDANGRTVLDFGAMEGPGYFEVQVPPGTDGKLWKIQQATGVRNLMTVPPYLARSADELLLPREVVEND